MFRERINTLTLFETGETKDLLTTLGISGDGASADTSSDPKLLEYVNLKLAARGLPIFGDAKDYPILEVGASLLANLRERRRQAGVQLCPADASINNFLNSYLAGVPVESPVDAWIPTNSIVLERHGLARILSLPPDSDKFKTEILESYRTYQGVCHNPQKDRRTTTGVFHIVEGGFPVPADKKEVPKQAFAALLKAAKHPPRELLRLPFTATQAQQAEQFVSLMLRPVVCPGVPDVVNQKSIEVRFFAPASLVANLDFVESIFGNAGDPYLPKNDARIDVNHWSGHTGCVILAPHLIRFTKKELGLPHVSEATDRQKRDGMCWENESDLYNDGGAFKITCRDHRGIMVTLIADNYFGYCKKEVKTQLSYAANLMGQCEEEHAGGALAFPRIDMGDRFEPSQFRAQKNERTFDDLASQFSDLMNIDANGFGIDKQYPDIYYVPENIKINLREQEISWTRDGEKKTLLMQPKRTYVLPSGFKVEMVKPYTGARWRLVGTLAEGTLCHKPCTVSGGGKSEISKPITDSMISGPILIYDYEKDMDMAAEIIGRDYGGRYLNSKPAMKPSRPLLSLERSFGSVIRLLTPNPEYTPVYNAWLQSIPERVRDLVFIVKRFYKPHWGENWRSRFSVDSINGLPGHELKYRQGKLATLYSRVGFDTNGSWRTFGLRKDFFAAEKLQVEDDISASIVLPAAKLDYLHPDESRSSLKFIQNCEFRLFQRPDEAITRGYDKTAEADFSRHGNFFSNYQPLSRSDANKMIEDAILFDQFSRPIRKVIQAFTSSVKPAYLVSTSNPRIVNGKPSANPRYLQNRPDLANKRGWYLAEIGARFNRRIPLGKPVHFPVNSVLPGRRNNPADHNAGIRPLAVYNPIHYQELPELFMEFISSLTGKSPSTTGAGSEGALTKGPFNALPTIIDLNNALVSYIVTDDASFTTSAGYIGPHYRFDHDISLVIPEVWSRMFIDERKPSFLIENQYLEKLEDFKFNGSNVLASRLGYRINARFVSAFFGRMFSNPTSLFTEEMLKPELQSIDDYIDGINNIVETQQRIAENYFCDGTVELACPPLRALLHIMAYGQFEGKTIADAEIRSMFSRESLFESDWYRQRLETQQIVERRRCEHHLSYLHEFESNLDADQLAALSILEKIQDVDHELANINADNFIESINGMIGADPAVLMSGQPETEPAMFVSS